MPMGRRERIPSSRQALPGQRDGHRPRLEHTQHLRWLPHPSPPPGTRPCPSPVNPHGRRTSGFAASAPASLAAPAGEAPSPVEQFVVLPASRDDEGWAAVTRRRPAMSMERTRCTLSWGRNLQWRICTPFRPAGASIVTRCDPLYFLLYGYHPVELHRKKPRGRRKPDRIRKALEKAGWPSGTR